MQRTSRPSSLPREPRKAISAIAEADPVIASAIAVVGKFPLPVRSANLHMLVSSVIGQSISLRAAEQIVRRFSNLYGDRDELTPNAILASTPEQIRAVGLTHTKTTAIIELARLWAAEDWSPAVLAEIPDDEVTRKLTALRGIGPWTAKMFLIFGLRRPDVLPHEDLGLRESLRLLYNLPARPSRAETEAIADSWRPWRTVGTVYAWQWLHHQHSPAPESEYGWW